MSEFSFSERDDAKSEEAAVSSGVSSGEPLLAVSDVGFAYPGQDNTLNGIDFSVSHGELVVLLGPNGSGKSTLLNCVMHLLEPQTGSILLDGVPVGEMGHRAIARCVAYVPQSTNVSFSYTVRDYVAMGRAPFLKMYASPSSDDLEKVDRALCRLGISDLAARSYTELSGGQQQLVDVARALAQDPQLILFDEPTSALDYGNQVKVLKMVKELSCEGYAIVMTTHNPDHPILLGSSVCLLDRDGRLTKGTVDEIMQEDRLKAVYQSDMIIRYVEDANRRVCMTARF